MRLRSVSYALSALLVLVLTTPAHAAPDVDTVLDITFPVAGEDIRFQDDYDNPRGGGRLHKSTDIMAPRGTPVHAAVGGTVQWITGLDGNPPSYGYMISIRGDDGLEHGYIHLGTQTGPPTAAYASGMARGVRVERGQLIGYVGNSGCGCVDHLHYDIEDPRYPSDDVHYDNFRYNPYRSLVAARARGDVPGAPAAVAVTGSGDAGRFHPLAPARVLDTREGIGAPVGPIAGGTSTTVEVTGVGGVPENGVVAVALNVTVAEPTAAGYVTIHPAGEQRPGTSTVNFTTGDTVPNMAVVKVGQGGRVKIFNHRGSAHVVLDVAGYYAVGAGGLGYVPVDPERILDTRRGVNGPRKAIGHRASRTVQVAGRGPVPANGVDAVVLNVTATEPTASSGYLTIHPSDEARPTASNLNFTRRQTVPNVVLAKLGPDGAVEVYNHSGATHVLFDVAGYYRSNAPDTFVPVTPTRVLDTRDGTGQRRGAVARTGTIDLSGLPDPAATAAVLNVTVTDPTLGSYLTAYPAGAFRPVASNLNWAPDDTVANMVVVRLGDGQGVDLFNYVGTTHVVADVMGYMTDG